MTYNEAVLVMIHDIKCGLKHINERTEDFKNELVKEISKAKCSIVTARCFLSFVETKFERGDTSFSLQETMLEAAIFIGNGLGLDPTTYNESITNRDTLELNKYNNFRG